MRTTTRELLRSLALLLSFSIFICGSETQSYAQEAEEDAPAATEAQADDTEDEGESDEAKESDEAAADKGDEKDAAKVDTKTFGSLRARLIGPALMSGRIGDFAVNPDNPDQVYAAVCSGGVWKTNNGGTTWQPIFDSQGSYSIGCVTLDPNNSHVVWVGTGENNSQRSVSFGDGVYRSRDGGKNWQHMGLKESEHIGMIAVDPNDSNVVYVAAQGPLWNGGGERGLYKTTDGGENWERVLHVSDDTGVNEVHLDPRDSSVIYASSYQRRRRVWTLINGGPESAIYKSTDAGATWRKMTHGIPTADKGRIGLDISPVDPDVVYAIIEAAEGAGGFFRSTDRGETWQKRSSHMASSPQYYNEIVCDPMDVDRVYALDTFLQVTNNGGSSFSRVPGNARHVDDHALWINPKNNRHLLVGCDGGVYESRDLGANWEYCTNLPITQFYRISVDNSAPFYNVYGGTQDNNSQGGPSRTTSRAGITNEDWFITVGGDGYETQVDPEDPNIVYCQWQYGGLVRHDRRSGEIVDIKPRELPGEAPYRWNWDSPLLLSPHANKRLYFAGNRLFQSDDGGDSWKAISDDLTRQLNRNALEVMGKIQNVDAVAKNDSTSIFGNCVSLDESPLVEGLIYVGTDDGLVQVTEDGGQNWRKIALFPGIPDMAYVSCVTASRHDADTVFVTFDDHKSGDFHPYILKSTDRGRSWEPMVGDLPEREIVYSLKEDHVDPHLLFVGTEFGAYFTVDGGEQWTKIGGLPTIAVRDLEIQRRENDLVLGTFGRSIYILDDYTPLRSANHGLLEKDASIFPVKDALRYVSSSRLGGRDGRGSQGAAYYTAKNPPFGAVITYYLKDKVTTRRERRKEREKKAAGADQPTPYPTIDELRAEDQEQSPQVVMVIRDENDEVVRRIPVSRNKGLHRVAWDLRYPSYSPIQLSSPSNLPPWASLPSGPLALPGKYSAMVAKIVDGEVEPLGEAVEFDVVPLELATFTAEDREEVMAFQKMTGELQRAVMGASRAANEINDRIRYIRKAVVSTPDADSSLLVDVRKIEARMATVRTALQGDRTLSKHDEPVPISINARVQNIVGSQWSTTSAPTQTQRDAYRYAAEAFESSLADLRGLSEDVKVLEQKLEESGAPWTPGRIPNWKMEE